MAIYLGTKAKIIIRLGRVIDRKLAFIRGKRHVNFQILDVKGRK